MRLFRWIIINLIFVISLYLGLFLGIEGAKNVALFMAWFSILASIFTLHEDVQEAFRKVFKKSGRTTPKSLNIAFDVCVIGAFVWAGFIFTGAAYLVHFILIEALWDRLEKETMQAAAN